MFEVNLHQVLPQFRAADRKRNRGPGTVVVQCDVVDARLVDSHRTERVSHTGGLGLTVFAHDSVRRTEQVGAML
jgi:hypothetical protein